MADPIRPTDDAARRQAARLLAEARHGALGVTAPGGPPQLSRVALLPLGDPDRPDLATLVSTLSRHWAALEADPRCGLLIEGATTGDPMAAPRLSLEAVAGPADKAALRGPWLAAHPGAALYYDFADFRALRLRIDRGFLVGGFARAFSLDRADLEN